MAGPRATGCCLFPSVLSSPQAGLRVDPKSRSFRLARIAVSFFSTFPLVATLSMAQESKPVAAQEGNPLVQVFEPREYVGSNKVPLKYRLLKPIQYEAGKKVPLILFLHGAGERGDDNASQLKHGAKDLSDAKRRQQYPCYIVVPQCPKELKWSEVDWSKEASAQPEQPSQSMQSIKELLDEMVETAGVDKNRIYITGLSMGGYGTWDAIGRYPDFFAAAIPICGGGDPKMVSKFSKLPIWCFHGSADTVVKPIRSREMVDALKKVGSPIQYTEYAGVGHDSWSATYSNPELYTWLFAQQKSDK